MERKQRLIAGGALTVALVAGVAGTSLAAGGGDSEGPIAGDALQRAEDAALAHTGGGTVTDTEVGDEESYYEVEVTLDDGTQVDVQLDEGFAVVGQEAESGPDDD
jgi:hypothetical protein